MSKSVSCYSGILLVALSRISVSIFVAFVARGLSSIPGHVFCYSAISSAGVVLILPGFTICEFEEFVSVD